MLDALKYINRKVKEILSSFTVSNEAHIFLEKAHFKKAIKGLNKGSCPSPDKITP